jgi:hypothetical protein
MQNGVSKYVATLGTVYEEDHYSRQPLFAGFPSCSVFLSSESPTTTVAFLFSDCIEAELEPNIFSLSAATTEVFTISYIVALEVHGGNVLPE